MPLRVAMKNHWMSPWRWPLRLLWIGCGLALSAKGYASCTLTTGSGEGFFGTVSSLSISQSQQVASVPDAGLYCDGAALALLGIGNRMDATVSSANAGALVRTGSTDAVPYQIFADPSYDNEIPLNTTFNYARSNLLDLLGLLGGSSYSLPMTLRTQTGDYNLAAGTYTDQLSVSWNWNVCSGVNLLFICLGRSTGSGTAVVNLRLEVSKDCVIEAPDLDFGSAPLVVGFNSVTQTISIRCTKDALYSVGLSDGSYADGGQRRMAADGQYLAYELYKSITGSDRWGASGSERRSSESADQNPGAYTGTLTQGFIYRAEILSGQSTPPAGTYIDMIVVDVAF